MIRHDKTKIRTHPILSIKLTNFDDSIANAPKWKHHLLRKYRIRDLAQLILCLETVNKPICCVTDGGCKDGVGSYGVSVGTDNSKFYSIEGPATCTRTS